MKIGLNRRYLKQHVSYVCKLTMKKIFRAYFCEFSGFSLTLWLILGAVFINAVGASTSLFLSLYLATHLHISITKVGIVLTGFGIGAMLGSYGSGKLSDKLSPHKVAVVALFGNALILFLLPFVNHVAGLFVITFLLGMFNLAFAPANRVALFSFCAVQDRLRANSLRLMVNNLGIGSSVFINGILSAINFKWVFIFNAIAAFMAATVLSKITWKLAWRVSEIKMGRAGTAGKFYFWRNSVFPLLCLTAFIANTLYNQIKTTYPIYLYHYYHISVQQFSYLFLLNTILIVIFQVPVLSFLKRYDQYLITGSGIFFMGLGLFILPFMMSYKAAIFSCLLWTLGEILFTAVAQVLFYEHAAEGFKGKAMGIYQMLYAFANMVGPTLGTWLYQFEHGNVLWYVCGVLGLLSLIAYTWLYLRQ